MIDLEDKEYFPLVEQIVDAICTQTQNPDRHFFRVMVNFHLALIPSMLRVNINSQDRGLLPINLYAFALAGSGYSKGHSLSIVEEQVLNRFLPLFLEDTFQIIAERNLIDLTTRRSLKKGTEYEDEEKDVHREYKAGGKFLSSYSEGSAPALKQMRRKLLMGNIGSLNLIVDEFGANMESLSDFLGVYLEGYDKGKMKEKLIKNTKDNIRDEEIIGNVPCNFLAFGTPNSIFDGGKAEEKFDYWMKEGYARRSFFAYSNVTHKEHKLSAVEIFNLLKNSLSCQNLKTISENLGRLADPVNYNKTVFFSDEVSIELIQYKMDCEILAETYGEHEDAKKAELTHRYFKAMKLSGVYAFLDNSFEVLPKHLYAAIKFTEDSGKHFHKMLVREKPYVRLAKYLAAIDTEVTQVDLLEANVLKGSESQKRELITLATAYGYKNNIIIKKIYIDGIEFFKGESLKETDLNKLILACSTQLAENYNPVIKNTSWNDLYKLTQLDGYHWITHHMIDNYRLEKNAIPGFNLIVIDVDGTISLPTAQLLLKEYTYLSYTTKRHTDDSHRFRLIFPISHELKLSAEDYTEFMQNVFAWLPFKVDDQTAQRSRKWLSHKGSYHYNDGILLDALQFIPKTTKAEEQKQRILNTQSLSNLERWFINNTGEGNRSNQLIKYALLLVDSGLSEDIIQSKVLELNNKLADKLEEIEIHTTIMKTVFKAITKRDN